MDGGFKTSAWKERAGIVLMLSSALILTGCQTMIPTGAIEAVAEAASAEPPVCQEWRAIRWSSRDTPETVFQIQGNNAARLGYGCKR